MKTPPRSRAEHAEFLKAELARVSLDLTLLREDREALGIAADRGLYLVFESEPEFELALKSLDREVAGIELMSVQQKAGTTYATVYVPEGKLGALVRLVESYATKDHARWGTPLNRTLIESISHIRRAALEAFWTDDPSVMPAGDRPAWWEVWLRSGDDADAILEDFEAEAKVVGLSVGEDRLRFLDRTVLLAFGTRAEMSKSVTLLDCVAELRLAKELASYFIEQPADEQGAWVKDLADQLRPPDDGAPSACILDTGVTREHPLIRPGLAPGDVLTCHPDWGALDHDGHGTSMAGVALHGDLTAALLRVGPIELEHGLESVKILAPAGQRPDAELVDFEEKKALYGKLTQEAAGRIEVHAPDRSRAFCMAVTTNEGRDRGAPSSWSAEVDRLCVGLDDELPRLFFLAAGNVDPANWDKYPTWNDLDQVHDPGQAWNAVTVGAYTERCTINAAEYPGWSPIALPGTLSPSSTTSQTWQSSWPNKPDFVLEGGNGGTDPAGKADAIDDLALLSTYFRPTDKLLVPFGDTSAASAQAARMAAILMARYPEFWPETIRGLLVHSAEWTRGMTDEAERRWPGRVPDYLLRRYGYGVADLGRACWSASNVLTLVAQDGLTPFASKGSTVGTKEMALHTLPWPRAELAKLFSIDVELRVTLSYFIEPNPARRGWKYRHRYQSHGLRFALRNADESLDDFRARVSKDAQGEDGEPSFSEPGWTLGTRRNRGSIHSDFWHGPAADLAARYHLAVFPTGGWWKERRHLGRWQNAVRYSLIVTIKTPATDVDIYTPVANAIRIAVPVPGT